MRITWKSDSAVPVQLLLSSGRRKHLLCMQASTSCSRRDIKGLSNRGLQTLIRPQVLGAAFCKSGCVLLSTGTCNFGACVPCRTAIQDVACLVVTYESIFLFSLEDQEQFMNGMHQCLHGPSVGLTPMGAQRNWIKSPSLV
jgi:hypothetical protein